MKPRLDATVAKKIAGQAPGKSTPVNAAQTTPKKEKRPSEPMPRAVEIWLEMVDRPDRCVFGWAYLGARPGQRQGVGIALNEHHYLVEQSLLAGDSRTLALLVALSLSELLLRRHVAWIAATHAKVRAVLLTPDQQKVASSIQFLAEAIAGYFAKLSRSSVSR